MAAMFRAGFLLLALAAAAVGHKTYSACLSQPLGRRVTDGATWTEPHCVQATCVNGEVSRRPCPPFSASTRCHVIPGDAAAEYPGCCATVKCSEFCFSEALKIVFQDGEKWTEPGCVQGSCSNGTITRLPCPLVSPGPGCVPVDGSRSTPYPGCCPSFKCPKPGQCYSESLDKFFDDGARWTEPPCRSRLCRNGNITELASCRKLDDQSGCRRVEGTPGAPFPDCCPSEDCSCYSSSLKKHFNDGATWTEPPCSRATCEKGNILVLGCPERDGPNCIREEGQPGAAYPQCCPKITCADKDQCFSSALEKIFSDGAKWTEPMCVSATCAKGSVSRKLCPPLLRLDSPRSCTILKGKPGSPYPQCCERVRCKSDGQRCYSRVNARYYRHRFSWSEGTCVRATCDNGTTKRRNTCTTSTRPKGKPRAYVAVGDTAKP